MGEFGSAVEYLEQALGDLGQSLDHRDAVAIMDATKRVGTAVDAVRAGRDEGQVATISPEIRARLDAMMPMIDQARVRVNVAADEVRQRINILAQQGVDVASPLYGR